MNILKSSFFGAAALAVLFAGGNAQAAPITVGAGQAFNLKGTYYSVTGSSVIAYSSAKVTNDNLGGIVYSTIAPAVYNSLNNTSSTAVSYINLDDSTGSIIRSGGLGGGLQVGKANSLMTGGSLSVTNLSFDSATKIMYADVHGIGAVAGDLGTVSQMAFFNVDSATGLSAFTGAGTFTSVLTGLHLTSTALDYVTRSFGLGALAVSVNKATDFGTATTTWTVSKVAAPVPEPSTLALMALGLFGVIGHRNRLSRNQ